MYYQQWHPRLPPSALPVTHHCRPDRTAITAEGSLIFLIVAKISYKDNDFCR